MLRLLVLVYLATVVPSAFAANGITVAQFEQILSSHQHDSDANLAERIAEVELTERVTTARLLRWETQYPGPRARLALTALADSSAFLDPPVDDQVSMPPPDLKTQGEIVSRSIDYVNKSLTRLPNFFASRDTIHFDDSPPAPTSLAYRLQGGIPQPLHMVSRFSAMVRYRDGAEIQEAKNKSHGPDAASGLTTRGEFGPILTVVLSDALHGLILWQRWESGSNDSIAVFRFQVPKDKSHYTVVLPKDRKMAAMISAYHGEIAIDPVKGDILRLTIVSDLDPLYKNLVTSSMMVEYGPVVIGDQTYTCPLRAVAYSRMPEAGDPDMWASADFAVITRINDVAFTQYHLFRAGSRIMDAAEVDPALRVQPTEEATTALASTPTPAGSESTAEPTTTSPPPTPAVAETTAAPPPPAPASVEPASTSATATSSPPMAPPGPTNVLHAHARLVLVDVVATDHGNPVHGLDRSQMHIFEGGHEQRIASFEEHTPRPANLTPLPPLPASTFTNVPALSSAGPLNVLLLDGLNTPPQNLVDAEQRLLSYVQHAPQGTAMAVFALGSQLRLVQGFSTDTAVITQAIKSADAVIRRSLRRPMGGSNPDTNNDSVMEAMMAMAKTAQARQAISHTMQQVDQHEQDAQAEDTSERVRATLEALTQLAHFLEAARGRKNLIWISGSFPAALIADAAETTADDPNLQRNNHDFTVLIRETSEAMAAARIAVYPLDARGIMTMPSANVDAERTHDVSLDEAGNIQLNPSGAAHDDANFRSTTQLEHGSMQQIAEETGGHAFVDTNDLQQAIAKAIDDGSSYYTIGYVPPDVPDTRFRSVLVKTDAPHLALSYRSGYDTSTPAQPTGKPSAADANLPMAAAITLGAPPSTQILLRARILPDTDPRVRYVPDPSESTGALTASIKGPTRRYVVDLVLDPATLTLKDDSKGAHHVEFDCALVAYNASAHLVNALDRRVRLDMSASQYQQVLTSGVPFQIALDLPAQPVTLRVAVYDAATGHTGSLETQIAAANQ